MKTAMKIFALGIIALGFAANSFAQSTATASVGASLVTPLSISKTADMSFATVAASATAGTIILDYANATTISGGAHKVSGSPTTASFTVLGEGTSVVNLTYPASVTLTSAESNTLVVDGILCDAAASGGTFALVGGTKTLKVKGTLQLPANKVAGTYTNATDLTVTINYN